MKAACFGVRDHRMVISRRQATARTADKLAILRRHPLFGQLSQAAMEHLGSYMKRRSLLRGTVIFAKGDPCTGLMGVLAGEVKISVPSADGREIVLTTMHEGDIFGEIALLDGHPRTADATAITDCELMVIEPRNFIIPFLRSQPDLSIQIIEILCSRVRRTTEQVEQPNPGNPTDGLQVRAKTKYTVQYAASGTQQTKTIQVRDTNGTFNVVSDETQKTQVVPSTQAPVAPSDTPK